MNNLKINFKKTIAILITSTLFFLGTASVLMINTSATINNEDNNLTLNYTSHPSITIESDADFITYGFPGNGTPMDPYRIENLHISGSGEAILIMSTTDSFVIQNCLIEDSFTGIYLVNIGPNTAFIIDNNIRNNDQGIYLYEADYTIIANNTMKNNEWAAIQVEYSAFLVIDNNTLTNGGIEFWYDVEKSIMMTTQVYNNTLNGKPLGWYLSETSLSLTSSSFSQIFLIDCNDVIISNFVSKSPSRGIYVFYSNMISIEDCYCGIEVVGSNNIYAANNRFDDTELAVYKTTDVIIEKNSYDLGDFEIHVAELCSNVIIRHNLCKGLVSGIYLEMVSYCIVENNTIENTSEFGMYLPMSDHIVIRNNFIDRSFGKGIYLVETNYCEIYQNIIKDCSDFGVDLDGWGDTSDYNRIFRNIFIENNRGGVQASDIGIGNNWYNTSTNEGNYWDDWSGTGIYDILGSAGKSDQYPLEDTDADGMDPKWEVKFELDPWNDDSAEDPDNDDLTNLQEYNINSNPRKNDTDSDGLEDGEEVNEYGTDPSDDDSDDDGLKDGEEVQIYLTDPNLNDSDGDGYLDGEEIENNYDPLDPNNPKKAAFEFFLAVLSVALISIFVKKRKK
jgi:parallel beta-helix repeat protein